MARPGKSLQELRADHRQASREHAAWMRDLERWRSGYHDALIACAKRIASDLEPENFETALDRHEAAIAAHEQAVRRHERALELGLDGDGGRSGDSLDFHRLMGRRHERSRATHEQLERSYRAIVAALELLTHR